MMERGSFLLALLITAGHTLRTGRSGLDTWKSRETRGEYPIV